MIGMQNYQELGVEKELNFELFEFTIICSKYGMALWKRYNVATISRLRSCYVKCMKLFFGYSKYHSVTCVLIELGLPSFDTLINSRVRLSVTVKRFPHRLPYILINPKSQSEHL